MWRLFSCVMVFNICFVASQGPQLFYKAKGDVDVLETPLSLEVPLPPECTVAGTRARSYNQGQCSRRPCTTKEGSCARSWQCCFEISQTSLVNFECAGSDRQLQGNVIVMCKCQVCSKLRTGVRGKVMSSLNRDPVVLAAITVGGEIATFTDQDGLFFFELTTINREVTLLFQESHHRPVSRTVNVHPSASIELTVVLEHIESVIAISKLQQGFLVHLSSDTVIEEHGLTIDLIFPADSFVIPDSNEVFAGNGELLNTLYHTGHSPDFSSPAIQRMLYTDSRGVPFTIQSHAMGSLTVVNDIGRPLALRAGTTATIAMQIKFGMALEVSSVENLHLFVFSEEHLQWKDHGRVVILSVERVPGEIGSLVILEANLRELNTYWALGFPKRVTCYIKTRIFSSSQQDLVDTAVFIEQSDDALARPSFYQNSAGTMAGVGACLASVCALGGIVSVDKAVSAQASPPSVHNGIVLGNKEQIIFYTTQKSQLVVDGRTPYYLTQEACMQALQKSTAFFKFVANVSEPPVKPFILPLVDQEPPLTTEVCFIKVAVYDCQAFTDIKVLSYSQEDHELLSLNNEIVSPLVAVDACHLSGMAQLRASCVQFSCDSTVHVTVQSRRETDIKDCRYWSSSASLPWTLPPANNMTSFHFTHLHSRSVGLYRSFSRDLAVLQCMSGSAHAPSSVMDPYRGTAVTFTCQV